MTEEFHFDNLTFDELQEGIVPMDANDLVILSDEISLQVGDAVQINQSVVTFNVLEVWPEERMFNVNFDGRQKTFTFDKISSLNEQIVVNI